MLSIIVAISRNNVIGINNELPWKLSGDLKYFQKITTGKSVLMGRKTFESIYNRLGKALPNRQNYVLSKTETSFPGAESVKDLNQFVSDHKNEEIFVIGGSSIYEQTMNLSDRLYVTEVDCAINGDAFFPKFDIIDFKLISEEKHSKDEKNEYNYTFKVYDRKK